jgi:hypothetical protein
MNVKAKARIWTASLAIVPILCLWPAGATAAEAGIENVTASGTWKIVKEDLGEARDGAVLDAKRNAVDQVGSRVIASTVVENFELVKDRIITKADGYVHRYDILEEGKSGSNFRVKIQADVSSSSLIDDATLIYNEMDKPRLMVVIPEVRGKDIIPMSHAENVVTEFFLEKGFDLIDRDTARENIRKDELRKIADGDAQAAAKVGLRVGAEAVVIGSASLGDVESVRDVLYASRATVSLRALRTDNAMIYAVSNEAATEAAGIPDAAQRKSLEVTSTKAAKDIFWKVVKKWNDQMMTGSNIEVILSGVSFSSLKKVINGFWEIRGITDVIKRNFDSPTAVLNITYSGDTMHLAEILDEERFEGFDIEVLTVSPGKMSLKVK